MFTFEIKPIDSTKNINNGTITFSTDGIVGYPSVPQIFDVSADNVLLGDADGDGRITINDAVLTISATFGTDPVGFVRVAADMDGDGRVTINDAILIINQTF